MSIGQSVEAFVDAAKSAGWRIELRDEARTLTLPAEVTERYGSLPPSFESFLRKIAHASTADEAVWFLCESDFSRSDANGFGWNEIERMSLASSSDDAERRTIASFWDRHLPIMMAPSGDYDFLAIALRDGGAVVHGYAPEWEDAEHVADSFEAWLSMLARWLRDPRTISNPPLALRVMAPSP